MEHQSNNTKTIPDEPIPTQVAKFLDGFNNARRSGIRMEVTALWNTWHSLVRFLSILWASYYLETDYDYPDLDKKIHDLIRGRIYKGNELLELCARIADFLNKTEQRTNPIISLLKDLDYHEFKLLVSAEFLLEEGSEDTARQLLMERLDILAERLSFLRDSSFLVKFDHKQLSKTTNLIDSEGRAEPGHLLMGDLQSGTGKANTLQLFPFLIFFRNSEGQIRTFLFTKWDESLNLYPYYQELYNADIDGPQSLNTIHISELHKIVKHEYIINKLFWRQANVTEKPYYSHNFFFSKHGLAIKLYSGNMLELHSTAKREPDKKYALVLEVSAGNRCQNKMIQFLKLIGERKCVDELMERNVSMIMRHLFSEIRLPSHRLLAC